MKIIKKILVIAIIISAPLFLNSQPVPPTGGGNGGHGLNGNQTPSGGGAPIDGGLSIMLLLSAAYGSQRVYKFRNKKSE